MQLQVDTKTAADLNLEDKLSRLKRKLVGFEPEPDPIHHGSVMTLDQADCDSPEIEEEHMNIKGNSQIFITSSHSLPKKL